MGKKRPTYHVHGLRLSKLLTEYKGSREELDLIAKEYFPMVHNIAHDLCGQWQAALGGTADEGDLFSVGCIALYESLLLHSGERGVLQSWIAKRVRCAMIDECRRTDPLPRSMRSKLGKSGEAPPVVPSHSNPAIKTKGRKGKRYGFLPSTTAFVNSGGFRVVSIDCSVDPHATDSDTTIGEILPDENASSSLDYLLTSERGELIVHAVSMLPKQQRTIIQAYFWEDMMAYEIAERMGVSEGRISQVFQNARENLKLSLTEVLGQH